MAVAEKRVANRVKDFMVFMVAVNAEIKCKSKCGECFIVRLCMGLFGGFNV